MHNQKIRICFFVGIFLWWFGHASATSVRTGFRTVSKAQGEAVTFVDPTGGKFSLDKGFLTLWGAGIFRTKSVYRVNGPKASLRLKETSPLNFEIQGINSGSQIRLFRLLANQDGRTVTLSHGKATGGRTLEQIPGIPFSMVQTNGGGTTIQPRLKLTPGEYGILLGDNDSIFCFAIEKN